MSLPGDPQREIGEAVDEVAKLLDFGIGQPAIGAENLAASDYGQHSTPGAASVNAC
jgi:hypothetical protein